MATTTRLGFRTLLRRGNPRGLPRAFVDRMYDDFDRDTRRAVLRLYRSVPDVAAAGSEAGGARCGRTTGPALVLWGRHDPYLSIALAGRQREAFPHAEIRVLDRQRPLAVRRRSGRRGRRDHRVPGPRVRGGRDRYGMAPGGSIHGSAASLVSPVARRRAARGPGLPHRR